ncbi:hypothetical protein AC240_19800 [Ralstonia sp. MD27]|nr:hypothetical protein AC240_19800 [Ralstonia sp. MD27]
MIERISAMSFNGAEGMAFEQFFLKRLNTTRATRDMLEATLLELHQGGEIVVVDESGAPPRVPSVGRAIMFFACRRSALSRFLGGLRSKRVAVCSSRNTSQRAGEHGTEWATC